MMIQIIQVRRIFFLSMPQITSSRITGIMEGRIVSRISWIPLVTSPDENVRGVTILLVLAISQPMTIRPMAEMDSVKALIFCPRLLNRLIPLR